MLCCKQITNYPSLKTRGRKLRKRFTHTYCLQITTKKKCIPAKPGMHFLLIKTTNYLMESNPCCKSALISIIFSIPTDMRNNPGNTPAETLSSGESCS